MVVTTTTCSRPARIFRFSLRSFCWSELVGTLPRQLFKNPSDPRTASYLTEGDFDDCCHYRCLLG